VLLGKETWDRTRALASESQTRRRPPRFWSRPSLLHCPSRNRNGIPILAYTGMYPIPHHTAKNVWKSRSKNQQESEKIAEIFMRKSREKIVTRYTQR
jgi:hypothetical protein